MLTGLLGWDLPTKPHSSGTVMIVTRTLLIFTLFSLSSVASYKTLPLTLIRSIRSLLIYSLMTDNVDQNLIFGIIFVEGQLMALKNMSSIDPRTHEIISDSLEMCKYFTKKYEDRWFNKFIVQKLVKGIAYSGFKIKDLPPIKPVKYNISKNIQSSLTDRNTSDYCIKQLLIKYSVSTKCLQLEMSSRSKGYRLSHQAIYFILLSTLKYCTNELKIENLIQSMCTQILAENKRISLLGYPEHLLDLYIEQVAVCGMYGYAGFLRDENIKLIMSLQTPKGCFHPKPEPMTHKKECDVHLSAVSLVALSSILYYN